MTRRGGGVAAGAVLGLCMLAAGAHAKAAAASGPTYRAEPLLLEQVPVPLYTPHFLVADDVTESWDYVFQFKEGYTIVAHVAVTNLGPGSGTGLALGWIIAPDGTTVVGKNSRKREEWQLEKRDTGMTIRLGPHRLAIDHPKHFLHMDYTQGELTIEARATTPAYQPGKLTYRNEGFYDQTILAPRLDATGTLILPGKPPLPLTGGRGVAVHTLTDLPDSDRAVSFLSFDTFDKGVQLSLLEVTAPEAFGNARRGVMFVVDGDRIVYRDRGYERSYHELRPDAEKPEYRIPGQFTFAGGGIKGDVHLELVHRDNLFSFIRSKLARWVLGRKTKARPVNYRFRGRYDIEMELDDAPPKRLTGTGFATLGIIYDPPEEF